MLGKVVMIRVAWNLELPEQFLFRSMHGTCDKGNKHSHAHKISICDSYRVLGLGLGLGQAWTLADVANLSPRFTLSQVIELHIQCNSEFLEHRVKMSQYFHNK